VPFSTTIAASNAAGIVVTAIPVRSSAAATDANMT